MIYIENLHKSLNISYVNESGKIEIEKIKLNEDELFEWKKPNNSKDKIFYINLLKKRKTYKLNKYRINELIHSLPKEKQKLIFNNNRPKLFFYDFKLKEPQELRDFLNAKSQILTISITNEKNQIIVFSIKKLYSSQKLEIEKKLKLTFDQNIELKYLEFDSERGMLDILFSKYIKNIPCLLGWNSKNQWAYLINRAKKLNLNPEKCSLSGKLITKQNIPEHNIVLDYIDIYKKYDTSILIKEDDSIEWATKNILKRKKQNLNSCIYDSCFEEFILHSANDSYLIYLLHKKLNSFDVFYKMSQIAHVELLKAFSPIHQDEMMMGQELLKSNKVMIHDENDIVNRERYSGGFIMDPKPGLYKNIGVFDFDSMYSTIIRQFNISPETYIGKDLNLEDENEYIITQNKCFYKKNKDNILKNILTNLFNERMKNKQISLEIENEINYLEKELKNKI